MKTQINKLSPPSRLAPTSNNFTAYSASSNKADPNNSSAELLVRYLEHIATDYVFGVPGGAIEPLYDALARSMRRGKIHLVNSRHESGAAFMADGYFRETGRLGVCMSTSGPGATNLITGVACAYDNNIPLLVITGQAALPLLGKGALQESTCTGINILEMFRHCTHYNSFISHPQQVETKIINAIIKAYQHQGPCHLSIPVDILRHPVDTVLPRYNLLKQIYRQPLTLDESATQRLLHELQHVTSPPPVFLLGYGASKAIEPIMQLINQLGAFFITTPDAKGLIQPNHPLYRGVLGLGGHHSAITALRKPTKTIIAWGIHFDEISTNGWSNSVLNDRLIHIDAQPNHFADSPMAKLHVHGCLLTIGEYLLQHLPNTTSTPIPISSKTSNPALSLESPDKYHSNAVPIKPQRLMKELSQRFPPGTRFMADAGNSMLWTPHYLQPCTVDSHYQSDFHSTNNLHYKECLTQLFSQPPNANWLRLLIRFAPMGWAIGAAIGAARANSQSPTVCITGDGSYLMNGQEITVAAQEQLPVIFVILNDSAYGMVMHGQRQAKAESIGYQLPNINYQKLAEAMSIPGHTIRSADDFDRLDVTAIVNRAGPTLIDVHIDGEEIPPMKIRLQTLGSVNPKSE